MMLIRSNVIISSLKDIHNIQFQYNIAGIQRQSMIEVVLGYGLKNYSRNHIIQLFCISNKINWMKISLHLKQPISFYVFSQSFKIVWK